MSATNPSGTVSAPFDITGTATFKPTLNAIKGTITAYLDGYRLDSKNCTTESCTYSYQEAKGTLYDMNHGGPHTVSFTAGGPCSAFVDDQTTFTVDKMPTVSVTSPSGTVTSPFNITGTATFKPTLNATKGTIVVYVDGYWRGTKSCTTESCTYDYQEATGHLYDMTPGGPHTVSFLVSGGGVFASDEKTFCVSKDLDGDGHYMITSCGGDDCNDNDATIYPGAPEVCDGKDNNCNGQIDEGLRIDADGDGHFPLGSCLEPADDCNDNDASIFPGAPEICDGKDNNCNGQTDEGLSTDVDGDGHYTPGSCLKPDDDCDDENPMKYPGLREICDNFDNNCNGFIDEGLNPDCEEKCVEQRKTKSSVNMRSGDLRHSQTLYETSNSVLPLKLDLLYSSLDGQRTLGKGWSHSYHITLRQNVDGTFTVLQGQGKNIVLYNQGTYYKPQWQYYPVLTMNGDGTYKLVYDDNTAYSFDQAGNLTRIEDKYTNALEFAYVNNLLSTITDLTDANRVITFTYQNGLVDTITDPNGNIHTFSYNPDKTLKSLTTQTPAPGSQTLIWEYTYYPTTGFLWTKKNPEGFTVTYEYQASNLYKTTLDTELASTTFTYDALTKTAQVTERDTGIWTYYYDRINGNSLEIYDPENAQPTTYVYETNRKTVTDPAGNTTTYVYDARGNLLSVTERAVDSTLDKTTVYHYDDLNRITYVKDPENHETLYTYDPNSNDYTVQDPALEETRYEFYSDGRIKLIRSGNLQTNFIYEPYKMTATDPTGARSITTYDVSGNTTSITDPENYKTQYYYDSLNRLIKIIGPLKVSDPSVVLDPALPGITIEYIANKKIVTDANGNSTTYEFNYNGQITKVADDLGNETTYEYGGTGCSSCGGSGDNLVSVTNANNKTTRYEYYLAGKLKKHIDPLEKETLYVYDPAGFVTSLTDPALAMTQFNKEDDVVNQTVIITKTDPLLKTTQYIYDRAGKLKARIDRKTDRVDYTYTPDGVLDTITYPGGSTVHFTNDELDRITSMQDSLGTTTYSYFDPGDNPADFPACIANAADPLHMVAVTDPHGFITCYKYDAAGKLKELTYPGDKKVTYEYDDHSRLWKVTNWLNQIATYYYDAAGRFDYVDNVNGTITDYGYDDANRLTSLENRRSDSSPIATYSFPVIDGVGNRMQVVQNEPLTPTLALESTSYTYNPEKNRLLAAGTDSFVYDFEGQLSNINSDLYTFDYDHRLSTISGSVFAQYSYDGKGDRLKAVRNGETTYFIYDMNGNALAEADGNKNITKYYIHGNGLMAMVSNDQTYTYHFNAIGSTVAMTDINQNIVNSYSYDPFGNILNQFETIPQPFKYVGQYGVMAEPNGFCYMRARYYDPKVGRFISEDPIGFEGGDVNLYAYVHSNPVNRIDPLGLAERGNCSHYQEVCKKNPTLYYCVTSQYVCDNWPDEDVDKSLDKEGWSDCVRRCLQDFDQRFHCSDIQNVERCMMPGLGELNTQLGNDPCVVGAHAYCFITCYLSK